MANTQVLLLNAIHGLGSEGDTVKVKAGYARNFLLPRQMAIPLNRANQKQVEALQARRLAREALERQQADFIADKLKKLTIAITVKTGKKGKLFGAVTAENVRERIQQEGIELNKKQLSMPKPVKELGKQLLHIKLHPEITVDFTFEVVSENPIEDSSVQD